ncbi:hypothetical protein [Aquiflexum sp.]|uniref:hypothetical protein n=1 Tax=Aquiflexum sp. TaxID=1872584 RepID=UPI0035947331
MRERANVPALTSMDANIPLAERNRELFAESWGRSDQIRFGRFKTLVGKRYYTAFPKYFPYST